MLNRLLLGVLGLALPCLFSCKQPTVSPALRSSSQTRLPGPQPDGSVLLPNQWSLRPAGRQIELRDFPANVALHPSGRYAAVLHTGYGSHQISIVDLPSEKTVAHVNITQAFYGLEFSKDGKHLFCSGAGDEVIHSFDFEGFTLSNHQQIRLRPIKERGIPSGLAVSADGKTIFAANLWADRISRITVGISNITEIALTPGTHALLNVGLQPALDPDVAAATKRSEVSVFDYRPEDTFPYACRLDEKRHRLYVSLWAQSAVAVIDLTSNTVIARWSTEEHPCEMALTRSGKFLFVANANRNTVSVFDAESGKSLETIWAALYPKAPPGSTPNSLALTPDEKTLFVANADNNAVAVFDVSTPGKSRSLGFIPVGWYPTSVRVTPDGKRLLVANGKGITPKANPMGPQPGHKPPTNTTVQYIAGLFRGTLTVLDLPTRSKFESQLKQYTAEAYKCSPLTKSLSVTAQRPADNPIPGKLGDPSPIKYVIYIVKENRTYDQVLGDMPEGNGDPKLCIFPEQVTPNEHKISRQFVLLDNFFAEAEVSADGHEWTMGAYASDFVEKMWPMSYGHNSPQKYPFPAEGNFTVAYPAEGYIWDRARQAGVSYRSYGEFMNLHASKLLPASTLVKSLQGHFDPEYPGFDLNYPDAKRADRFISELSRFEKEGDMPRLQIVRLPNDHTHGTTRGKFTPTAYVADNDLAFGRIIEAVSHSKFWPQTAVFTVEDDAQNGPDHVDAHRTIAFVVSPYTKRNTVDSSLYSTTSMLRTIELILGLKPMSQFDAAARPMYNSFQAIPDLTPYITLPANVDLHAQNPVAAWGGRLKMNFTREDAVDDLLLNEVVWRSVRGSQNQMPAPIRAGFVFPHPKIDDDD